MGCVSSKTYPSDIVPTSEQKALNNSIEEMINKERADAKAAIKVLLLGTADSGKSTILKQMKILHLNGFTPEDLENYRPAVHTNTVMAMQAVCKACATMEIPFDSPRNGERARAMLEVALPIHGLAGFNLRDDIEALWKDSGVLAAYKRKSEFQLMDSAGYFLENTSRTFAEGYVPTNADILRIRQPTTGMWQTDFVMEGTKFQMYDVGGQRGERKKWIHYFEDVTAILYICATSDYDQVSVEDRTKNRLNESLELFSATVNLPWFKRAHVILFLNKDDIFRDKITTRQIDLGIYFPAYTGGCVYKSALEYIQDSFFDRITDTNRNCYCHVTDATSTDNIRFVWTSTKHMILEGQLTSAGLQMM